MRQTMDLSASDLVLDVEGVTRSPIVPRTALEISGKKVFVFDDVFTQNFVDTFGLFLMRCAYRFRPSFDNELSADLATDLFMALPALPDVADALLQRYHAEMTTAQAPQVLSHVYAAAIRFGDSCAVHQDVQCDDCVTFLYYGNVAWNGEWGGETVFYDDEVSAAACVSPRPGRLVLFNAALHHRAGAPARDCPTFRYGLSVFYRCDAKLQHRASPNP